MGGAVSRARLAGACLLVLLGGLCAVGAPPPKLRLVTQHQGAVRIGEPVTIAFDQPLLSPARVRVELRPSVAAVVRRERTRFVITPVRRWEPAKHYTVTVSGAAPKPWQGGFTTQPRVAVTARVDGQPVAGTARIGPRSHLDLAFAAPMRTASVSVLRDGKPLAAKALRWSPDATSVGLPMDGLTPYQPVVFSAGAGAMTAAGLPVTDQAQLQVTMLAALPASGSTGVGPGFRPQTPIEIVVENSPPAQPQAGLQGADIVYEYLSEYQVTRMTAIYFAHAPALIGPVRSCRTINAYLAFAYDAVTMCTGASDGTLHYLLGIEGVGSVPTLFESFDQGNHFFRSASRAIPHNAYTSGGAAERLRSEWPHAPGDYAVDPPHDDAGGGEPAAAPAVPLHSMNYGYDPASRLYLRYDHGAPFVDQVTNAQLQVKNVVLLHVPFRDAGWVEDENGGAHSVWYDLLGSGPAEIYSNGQVLDVTWHMGAAVGQPYYDDHAPVWFTDADGKVVLLNTGLTWIHVLGNGQSS